MSRWISPVVFLGAAAWVYSVNSTATDRVVILPMLNVFVGDSPYAQGQLTWQICLALGVLFTLWALFDMRRGGHEAEVEE